MRAGLFLLVSIPLMFACEATQQIGGSAADNAKPAIAPVLTERPPLSSMWSNEPGKIYIGAKLFGVGINHNLFNRISVKLDGREAIELPRGTAGNFQPIDRSQLQTGNVYFRITVEQTDANQQTQVDALEIVDTVLRPLGTVTLGQDIIEEQELVVRETSINPAYAGTPDEWRESTWTVSFNRNLSGPPGQGWLSRCEFSFPQAFSQTSRSGLPGARVGYSFSSTRCKRLGVLRDGARSNVIELATDAGRYGDVFFDIPTDAQVNSTINFQIFGEDLLKRVSYFNAKALVKQPPPPKPCPTDNGAAGNLIQFRFCGICGEERVPVQNFSCDSTEGRQAAIDSLAERGNCNLFTGSCPACPVTTANPAGQVQVFPFCVATPAGVFAWNISDTLQPACSSDDAKEFVELQNSNSEVTPGGQQGFPVCTSCPGQTPRRDVIPACAANQALDIQRAQNAGCEVTACP
ncbi:MAG TPA: hypothetical protein VFO82_09385 [Steroidobacteraceae bacterium]|nr:hypothetical protein [Steroidobacteraceae bacterium]